MSVNVNYCDTFLSALSKSYTSGDYIHTLGFASVGDGGAAMYKVSSDVLSDDVLSDAISCTVAGTLFNYVVGNFYTSNSHFFQLVPQYGKVYAEQFGVLPDETVYYDTNTTMMNCAVEYASSNGFVLAFASKKTYYFGSSIVVKSNLLIEGNGATMRIYNSENKGCYLFNMKDSTDLQNNITVRNLTVVGKTTENQNFEDQAFHVCIEGFTLQNVTIKNFNFGVHTYGRYTTNGDYTVPEIPNKNWLIEDCSVVDTFMGFQLSEIDGIIIKNSVVTSIYPTGFPVGTYGNHSYYDAHDYPEAHIFDDLGVLHNIYLSSNCLNVRINNVLLGNVTGDAVHKAFAARGDQEAGRDIRADISKNHFYTDLSIHKCNAPLNIGYISENVMCDNVHGTNLRYLVHFSAASNCIVSNSSLTVDRDSFKRPRADNVKIDTVNPNLGLYVTSACSCWFQNSYLNTNKEQRTCVSETENSRYRIMSIKPADSTDDSFVDKRYKRCFIGPEFDIPNHWFKFTGCEFKSNTKDQNKYYFSGAYDLEKAVFHEYWDNCKLTYSAAKDFFRLKCINSIPAGITIRNSYLKYDISDEDMESTNIDIGAPFRFQCGQENCNCLTEDTCLKKQLGKRFPFVHYENNVLDKFLEDRPTSSWNNHINTNKANTHNFTIPEAVTISGSYVSGVYRLKDGKFSKMSDLDKSNVT